MSFREISSGNGAPRGTRLNSARAVDEYEEDERWDDDVAPGKDVGDGQREDEGVVGGDVTSESEENPASERG